MPKFCPNCGAGLVDDQKYCRKCGSSLMTAELTARRDPRSRQLASPETGTQAQTVRNLDPNTTGEMSPAEDGGTRTIGSAGVPSSILPGTQRIEGSRSLDATVPTTTAGFGMPPQPQPQAAQPVAKKGFPIVAVLSIVVIFLLAAVGVGYWLYTRSRNTSVSNSTDSQASSQPQATESSSTSASAVTGETSGAIPSANVNAAAPGATKPTTTGRDQQNKNSSTNSSSGSETAKPSESDSTVASKPAETNKDQSVSTAVTPTKTLTADDHIKAGIKAFDSGNYSQALTEYTTAARLQPSNSDVHYLMGLTYERLKKPADALAEYQKCTSGPYADVSKKHVKRLSK